MIVISLSLILAAATPPPSNCTVTDGDTIRCGDERIRLLGIDAPEIHGCRKGRVCVAGDGQASKRSLERAVAGSRLSLRRLGKDRYGRTLGVVYATKNGTTTNLACHQMNAGQAEYVGRWDDKGVIAKECR